jgi:hypothetical protein
LDKRSRSQKTCNRAQSCYGSIGVAERRHQSHLSSMRHPFASFFWPSNRLARSDVKASALCPAHFMVHFVSYLS